MIDCVFCEKLRELSHAPTVVHFEPLNPVTPGHMLFVPTTHIRNAGENPMIASLVMATAAEWAAENYSDYNIITSAGIHATQTVMHLHLHVVPRRPNDGLYLPWTKQK